MWLRAPTFYEGKIKQKHHSCCSPDNKNEMIILLGAEGNSNQVQNNRCTCDLYSENVESGTLFIFHGYVNGYWGRIHISTFCSYLTLVEMVKQHLLSFFGQRKFFLKTLWLLIFGSMLCITSFQRPKRPSTIWNTRKDTIVWLSYLCPGTSF